MIADNYDFMPIFGGDDLLIFRCTVRLSERYREVVTAGGYGNDATMLDAEISFSPPHAAEPGSLVLLLGGTIGLAAIRRRRRQQA